MREIFKEEFLNLKKILIDFNAKSQHLSGQSADRKFAFQMK